MSSQFFPVLIMLLLLISPLAMMPFPVSGRLKSPMYISLLFLGAYSCTTLSGLLLLTHWQAQQSALQLISGLLLLLLAACMYLRNDLFHNQKNKQATTPPLQRHLALLLYSLAASVLSALLLFNARLNGVWQEGALAIFCVVLVSVLIAQQKGKFSGSKNYVVVVINLQKFLALILVVMAVQHQLSCLSEHSPPIALAVKRNV